MMPSEVFMKWTAKALTAAKKHTASIWAATYSTADFLFENMGFYVHDLKRIKEAKLKEIEAETDKKVNEAAEIANRINLSQRNQAIVEIEGTANARKTIDEAQKIVAETETIEVKNEIMKQMLVAKTVVNQAEGRREVSRKHLVNALEQLQEEGGKFYADSKHLSEIIQKGFPTGLDQEEAE